MLNIPYEGISISDNAWNKANSCECPILTENSSA